MGRRRYSSPTRSRRKSARPSKSKSPPRSRSRENAGGPGIRAFVQVLVFVVVGLVSAFWNKPEDTSKQLADMDFKLRQSTTWIQTQLDMIDSKISEEMTSLKKEVERVLEAQAFMSIQSNVETLKSEMERLESCLANFRVAQLDEKLDVKHMVGALADNRALNGSGNLLNVEDLRVATSSIVEDAIEDHSADGIGRVDYALATGGGKILGHSEAYYPNRPWFGAISSLVRDYVIHPKAYTVLEPSFGEPGQCLPLKGSDVYIDIQLRRPIYPDSITLQHASKKVAYDIGSAPKDFQVLGWLQLARNLPAVDETSTEDMTLLGEFTYQLDRKSSVQNFRLNPAVMLINRIRLHVLSNYGCLTHTCIYRFRVHGSKPNDIPPS